MEISTDIRIPFATPILQNQGGTLLWKIDPISQKKESTGKSQETPLFFVRIWAEVQIYIVKLILGGFVIES